MFKQLLFPIILLLLDVSLSAQSCQPLVVSYELSVDTTFKSEKLVVQVYSSCYLETYPFLEVYKKNTEQLLVRADLESFGQSAETIQPYTVRLPEASTDLQQLDIYMISKMNRNKQKLLLPVLPVKSGLTMVVDAKELENGNIDLTFNQSLKNATLRVFSGGDLIFERELKKINKKLKIKDPELSDAASLDQCFFWISGKSGDRMVSLVKEWSLKN